MPSNVISTFKRIHGYRYAAICVAARQHGIDPLLIIRILYAGVKEDLCCGQTKALNRRKNFNRRWHRIVGKKIDSIFFQAHTKKILIELSKKY